MILLLFSEGLPRGKKMKTYFYFNNIACRFDFTISGT